MVEQHNGTSRNGHLLVSGQTVQLKRLILTSADLLNIAPYTQIVEPTIGMIK